MLEHEKKTWSWIDVTLKYIVQAFQSEKDEIFNFSILM